MHLTKKEQCKNTDFTNKGFQGSLLSKSLHLFLAIITFGVWFMIMTIREIITSQQAYSLNKRATKNLF